MLGFMFLKQDSSTGMNTYGLQVLIIIHAFMASWMSAEMTYSPTTLLIP